MLDEPASPNDTRFEPPQRTATGAYESIQPAIVRHRRDDTVTTALQATQQTLEQYLQALTAHDDFGKYFSNDVVVAFAGTDHRAEGREAATQLIAAAHELGEIKMGDVFVSEGHAAAEADFIRRDGVTVPYAVIYDLDAGKITGLRIYMTGPVQ